ncbi:MAG: endonuclease III domain-containing protein [Gammaproteobacteria bacterium]|nr:endonuclease III domain-containing protein [Gammaproteobacteria bacterium]
MTKPGLKRTFQRLLRHYGPQHWWPADAPFEMMAGAVLTQNTAWSNVARALSNLTKRGLLAPETIIELPNERLAELVRPAGYFNVKARRLKNFCAWYLEQGGYEVLSSLATPDLRRRLLSVNGIGRETADDILLYAFNRPVFVIDAYTRRLFTRLGHICGSEDYETLRNMFETKIGPDVPLYNEYHALIVRHAKEICRKLPRCSECCLALHCPFSV